MRDYLFSVNKENAYSLQKKFSLDEDETEYLHRNFWPIITLTEIEVDEFQGLLNKEKSEFRKKRGRFVIELFKRDYLDFLIDELNSYLDNINRRRNKIYNVVSDTYFHWFKLEADIKTYTLLLSKKDELNLEIYFIDLLDVIKSFISENEALDKEQNRTKKVIAETFENMDKKGWQYAFVSEQDYNLFTDLLTNFFEYKPYTLPETIIQLKRTCKTKVAKALGEIHKELSNENKLSTDTKYFQLIRVLSHFEKETEGDLYKALTR